MSPVEPDPREGLNGAVADELRAMKSRRRMSNEQIAEASGIPLVSVNRYMSASRPINLATLAALTEALGSDPNEITRSALAEMARRNVTPDDYALAAHDEDFTIEEEQEGMEELP